MGFFFYDVPVRAAIGRYLQSIDPVNESSLMWSRRTDMQTMGTFFLQNENIVLFVFWPLQQINDKDQIAFQL